MSRSLHFSTLSRTIVAAVAALVLAASAAPAFAMPARSSGYDSMCAGLTLAECERQVLASRGTSAPVAQSSSSDAGSGWTVPAVGATAVGAVALVALLAVHRRRHWRPSQSAATH
jgi:hypothetical protein